MEVIFEVSFLLSLQVFLLTSLLLLKQQLKFFLVSLLFTLTVAWVHFVTLCIHLETLCVQSQIVLWYSHPALLPVNIFLELRLRSCQPTVSTRRKNGGKSVHIVKWPDNHKTISCSILIVLAFFPRVFSTSLLRKNLRTSRHTRLTHSPCNVSTWISDWCLSCTCHWGTPFSSNCSSHSTLLAGALWLRDIVPHAGCWPSLPHLMGFWQLLVAEAEAKEQEKEGWAWLVRSPGRVPKAVALEKSLTSCLWTGFLRVQGNPPAPSSWHTTFSLLPLKPSRANACF